MLQHSSFDHQDTLEVEATVQQPVESRLLAPVYLCLSVTLVVLLSGPW